MKTIQQSSKTVCIIAAMALCLCTLFTNAQTPPTMGAAGKYALLAGDSITVNNPTVVGGKTGSMYGRNLVASIDTIDTIGSTKVQAALTALSSAIGSIVSQSATPISSTLNGQTLAAGVYSCSNARLNGTLTLTGSSSAKYIFKITGKLDVDSLGIVSLGSVKPENIYWYVSDSLDTTRIGGNANFSGVVLTKGNIIYKCSNTGHVELLSRYGVISLIKYTDGNHFQFYSSVYSYAKLQTSAGAAAATSCLIDDAGISSVFDHVASYDIVTAKNGDIFIAGTYYNSVAFGAITLSNTGANGFIAKYSGGGWVWAESIDGDNTGVANDVRGIDVDNATPYTNIYIIGFTDMTVTDAGSGISLAPTTPTTHYVAKFEDGSTAPNLLFVVYPIVHTESFQS